MSINTRTTFPQSQAVPEGSTRVYSTVLKDVDGDPIPQANVISLTVRIDDIRTGSAVRAETDIISSLHSTNGTLTYKFNGVDTLMVGTGPYDRRLATFHVVYIDGEEYHEVEYLIDNLTYVP